MLLFFKNAFKRFKTVQLKLLSHCTDYFCFLFSFTQRPFLTLFVLLCFRSHIRRYLTKVFFPVCSRRYGNVLIVHYILCKLLYLLNVVVQLFALDLWLGTKYHQYGIEVAVNIIKKLPWSNGHRFPQVTLCDFSTRDIGTRLRLRTPSISHETVCNPFTCQNLLS